MVLSSKQDEEIKAVVSRLDNHKILYEKWGLSKLDRYGRRVAVNFYGPPGTGKTMSAEALASHLKLPIIEINYAEIESK